MLSTIFKGRNPLAAARADKRLGAILALTPEKAARLRDELAACARNDDPQVRRAAIGWVEDQQLLEALLEDPDTSEASAERLVALGADSPHPTVRKARMRAANSPQEALAAASGVAAPDAQATLFLNCPEPHREALLPAIRLLGEPGLTALEHQSRNHDKQANRTARAELESLRASNRAIDELSRRAEELKNALERDSTDATPARALQLRRSLEECAEGVRSQEAIRNRFGLETPNVDEWLADVEPAPEAEPPPATGLPGFDALVAGLEALRERMMAGEASDSLRETRDDLVNAWLARSDRAQPDAEQQATFETVTRQFRELGEAADRQRNVPFQEVERPPEITDWPQDPEALQELWKTQRDAEHTRAALQRKLESVRWPDWTGLPEPLQAVADTIEGLERFAHGLAEHQLQLEDNLAGLIEKTGANAKDGQLKPAQSTLGQARKIARSLPERIAHRHRKALVAAATRVDELQDWQSYATSPKRQELLDSLSTLAESAPGNAKDRADRIKALRAEWNALGPLSGSNTRAMHAEFNRLAEQAFEPCRAHFNEQAKLRKENLEERRHICEQLEQYLDNVDWATADMRAAEQIMRAAREEWRAYHPVDRRHAKDLDTRFEALQERIYTQVKKVWDANLAAKQAIVESAEKLASGEASMADKIREAKALQRQWRDVGMTPRKPDQKLWRQFREQCDLIFNARESDRQQATGDRESAITRAEAICETMQEAVAKADSTTADRATLARLRAELNAIRLPERLEKSLHRRFDEIARSYNQLILAGEIDNLCKELEDLKAGDIDISRAESEGRDIAPPAPVFETRTAGTDEPLPALHRLTLEAELLAGVESPPGDRQLRLEVQVDALNQSMGKRAAEKEPRELAEAWCLLGPKGDASDPLRERFFSALLKLARPHDR